MNSFFMEFLIKERQQQILDEIRRNQIFRTNNNLKGGFFNKSILKLSGILITIRNLQNSYRPLLNRN